MPSFTGNHIGLTWGFIPHEDGWQDSYNLNFQKLEVLTSLIIIDTQNDPPVSPNNDDVYIVGSSPTGAWFGHDNELAVWTKKEDPDTRDWVFFVPDTGWRGYHSGLEYEVIFFGSWIPISLIKITAPAAGDILRFDGVDAHFLNVRPMRGLSFGSNYDPGAVHTADQVVFVHRFGFKFTIVANFDSYQGSTTFGGAADADADVVIRVQKSLVSDPLTFSDVGTITIGAGTTTISDQDSSDLDITFELGDTIRVMMPTSPDATFAGVFGTIIGYETAP